MKWVTRERPKVDRIACPWLIRRFVDPEAQFFYLPADQVMPFVKGKNAIPYDVPDVELGHRGARCSFDAILDKYRLDDPALRHLARIVRGADTADKDLTPESRGLEAIARGFGLVYEDDHRQLEAELPVYDALYAWCRAQAAVGGRRALKHDCTSNATTPSGRAECSAVRGQREFAPWQGQQPHAQESNGLGTPHRMRKEDAEETAPLRARYTVSPSLSKLRAITSLWISEVPS
jgi:hypothetical protein